MTDSNYDSDNDSDFIDPSEEWVHLDLPNGRWIEVLPRLSYGDELRFGSSSIGGIRGFDATGKIDTADAEVRLDNTKFEVERILIWVKDWSLKDPKDNKVPITREAVLSLNPRRAQEIKDALDKHVEKVTAKKTVKSGKSTTGA